MFGLSWALARGVSRQKSPTNKNENFRLMDLFPVCVFAAGAAWVFDLAMAQGVYQMGDV